MRSTVDDKTLNLGSGESWKPTFQKSEKFFTPQKFFTPLFRATEVEGLFDKSKIMRVFTSTKVG